MENKRYRVCVEVGIRVTGFWPPRHPGDVTAEYEHHYFDTYVEARDFAAGYPEGKAHVIDQEEELPF
jgi:hypothetical protein